MCGISGAVSLRPGHEMRELVERIICFQHRRGPDSHGLRQMRSGSAQITMGHNRLAIIDPVAASNQPFVSDDGRLTMVFNGAIYNYKELRQELEDSGMQFRTESDTEVLLAAFARWGEPSFDRLYGMFAFAVHDAATNRLYLVRDRFGVKPLHYWVDGGRMAFASMPNPLAEFAQLPVDLEYFSRGIRLKYYEDETAISPFRGVSAVPPAHYVRFDLDGIFQPQVCRYYDLAAGVERRAGQIAAANWAELRSGLSDLLEDSCRLRLRADVPVGISVSGGLDSSTIAAVISDLGVNLHAFTFGLPDDSWSEGPLVRQLATERRLEVSYVWPTGQSEIEELFDRTLAAQGAPFPHTSQMAQYAVFADARAKGIKVLIGGQGGDEALMGYRKFFLFAFRDIMKRRSAGELASFAANATALFPALISKAGLFWSERHRYTGREGGMDSRLNLPGLLNSPTPGIRGDSLRDRQILDIIRFSLPSLLRYEDRNSMGNSVESRLPFLDHRLLEYGVALPVSAKLRDGFGKYLLRDTMKGRLPDSIRISRDKRGFDTKQAEWIGSGLGSILRSRLEQESSVVREFLPRDTGIGQAFSDAQLIADPQAFKEAVSLVWLARPYGQSTPELPSRATA